MEKSKEKQLKKIRRRIKIRSRIIGTAKRLRLSVFKSNKSLFLQLIDDQKGVTVFSAHTKELKANGNNLEISKKLGKLIAEKAVSKGVSEVVFDRGGNKFHGKIEAVAEGAREGGLKF
jgi:large subunit ribosomal protein L18